MNLPSDQTILFGKSRWDLSQDLFFNLPNRIDSGSPEALLPPFNGAVSSIKKGGKGVKKGASMISLNSGEKNFLPKKPTTKFSKRKVIENFSNFWQKSTFILDLAHQVFLP